MLEKMRSAEEIASFCDFKSDGERKSVIRLQREISAELICLASAELKADETVCGRLELPLGSSEKLSRALQKLKLKRSIG